MDKFPLTTKRLVLAHVSVCQGCCCGNPANGKPAVPVEWLKKEWRARGSLKRINCPSTRPLPVLQFGRQSFSAIH